MSRSPLTWQQVTAPDFTNAGKLLDQANKSFNSGMGNLTSLVRQNANNYQEDANELMQQRALQNYGDIGALQQMYNSGELTSGINPANVKANNVAALMNSAVTTGGSLLKNKGDALTFQNKVDLQDLYDNNAEALNNIDVLMYNGAYEKARQAAADLDAPGHIVNTYFNNLVKDASSANTLATDADKRIESTLTARDAQLTSDFATKLESMPADETTYKFIDDRLADPTLRPTTRAAFKAIAAKLHPGLFEPVNPPPSEAIAESAISSQYGRNFANMPISTDYTTDGFDKIEKADAVYSDKNIGSWSGFDPSKTKVSVLISDESSGYVNEKGQKTHRAMGVFQFMPSTLRDAIKEGVLSENDVFDAKNQYKAGRWLYNKQNSSGKPMTNRWVALAKIKGADAPDAWKDIPWEVAERFIRAGESEGKDLSKLTMEDVRNHVALRDTTIKQQQEKHKTALIDHAKLKPTTITKLASGYTEEDVANAGMFVASVGGNPINIRDAYTTQVTVPVPPAPTLTPRQLSNMSTEQLQKQIEQIALNNPTEQIAKSKLALGQVLQNLGISGSDPGVLFSTLSLQQGLLGAKLTTDALVKGDASPIAGLINETDSTIPIKLAEKYASTDKDGSTKNDFVDGFNKIKNEITKVNDERKKAGLPPVDSSNKTAAFILDHALQGNWNNWPDMLQGSTTIGGELGIKDSKIKALIGSLAGAQASGVDYRNTADKAAKLQKAIQNAEGSYNILSDPALKTMHDYMKAKDPNKITKYSQALKNYEEHMRQLLKYMPTTSQN